MSTNITAVSTEWKRRGDAIMIRGEPRSAMGADLGSSVGNAESRLGLPNMPSGRRFRLQLSCRDMCCAFNVSTSAAGVLPSAASIPG